MTEKKREARVKGLFHRGKKALAAFLAALLLTGVGCAGKGSGGTLTGEESGTQALPPTELPADCVILYGEGMKEVAAALKRALAGMLGSEPACRNAAEVGEEGDFVFLVGDTGREASADFLASLAEGGYGVKILHDGTKTEVLLAGTAPYLSEKAVYLFLSDYLSEEEGGKVLMKNEDTVEKAETAGSSGQEEDKNVFAGIRFEEDVIYVTENEGGYARMCTLADGTILCTYDCRRANEPCSVIRAVTSSDMGKTWSEAVKVTEGVDEDLWCANPMPYQLEDGTILVSYRANAQPAPEGTPGPRYHTSIRVMQSKDGGKSWTRHSILWDLWEESPLEGSYGLWEPHFGMLNGELACFIAIGKSVYNLNHTIRSIDIFVYRNGEWVRADYTSEDGKSTQHYKNGMPVWQPITEGGYILAIETTRYSQKAPYLNGMAVKLFTSRDGKDWVDQCDVYLPHKMMYRSAAPYVVQLPDGRFLVSYMTDEDLSKPMTLSATEAGMRIKLSVSKPGKTAYDLSSPDDFEGPYDVFRQPAGRTSTYAGMMVNDEYLYVYSYTNFPSSRVILRRARLDSILTPEA